MRRNKDPIYLFLKPVESKLSELMKGAFLF